MEKSNRLFFAVFNIIHKQNQNNKEINQEQIIIKLPIFRINYSVESYHRRMLKVPPQMLRSD